MKCTLSIRPVLILLTVLFGVLLLSACATRRTPQPYVYMPHRLDAQEERGTQSEQPNRARRAPRARTQQEQQAAPSAARTDSVLDQAVVPEDESPRSRWLSRSSNREQSEARDVEIIVAEPESIEAEDRSRSGGLFGFLRRSSADDEVDASPEARAPRVQGASADAPATVLAGDADVFSDAVVEIPLARGYRLRPADQIAVSLRGIPEQADFEFIIPDDGYINMPYIAPVQAEGLTISELQRRIHESYVEEQIYRQLSVNVLLPTQHYFVRGEVRQPGRFPLTSGMTVLKAIAAAGGYTEFANPRRVEIIRAGETITGNARQMEQNPEEDYMVKAGDVIIVRRSIF